MKSLAYRTGTKLIDRRTGESYRTPYKTLITVQHVELLLPEDAPEWARDIQELIAKDRQAGVQMLSDIAEAAERRKDSQVYREFEFALPRELSDEQCIKLATEFIKDQMCGLGMAVLPSFHFDVDEETGERKPHCHPVMLTRRLEESGLAAKKERDWNNQGLGDIWREQLAAYTNFHLKLHGHDARVDHRSYVEQGIEIEPQPKRGTGITAREGRELERGNASPEKPYTDKEKRYRETILRNTARIIKRPEVVFEIVSRAQATFMWGDVERVLSTHIKDHDIFDRLNAKLKESHELILLRHNAVRSSDKGIEDLTVYTTRTMLKREVSLVSLAEMLDDRSSHKVRREDVQEVIAKFDQKLEAWGGLSQDQKKALRHVTSDHQLSCIVGYAGAGKTTAMEAAKEIWERSGYAVYGLAPTGIAAQNLEQSGIKSQTLHKFLKGYEQGRNHLKPKSVLILDEAGMVDTKRFEKLLRAVDHLGVKLVVLGDGAQLQPIEAGPAFRLVTESIGSSKLETVIRQKEPWQKEATKLFGTLKTREALEAYHQHGHVHFVEEKVPSFEGLKEAGDHQKIVSLYNLSRRMSGTLYHKMIEDLEKQYPLEGNQWKYLGRHQDYALFKEWQDVRIKASEHMLDHIDACRGHMVDLGVDPKAFAEQVVDKSQSRKAQKEEAIWLVRELGLSSLDPHQMKHVCDLREQTRQALLERWHESIKAHPEKSQLICTYSKQETARLNEQVRFLMKQDGVIAKEEFLHTIHRKETDDFGKETVFREIKPFAVGDRLIFKSNDSGLGVSNGSLGTIEQVDANVIRVKLDSPEGQDKAVSFAPRLYPHFDQGWTANIHKTQGVTVDKNFVLATHHDYRNLAYVGMTRHRESVEVYGSKLDFWREDIFFDRLSSSHEKLSVLDYVDIEKASTLLNSNESKVSQILDRLGNQLQSMKFVSKQAWQDIAERFLGHTPPEREIRIPQGSLSEEVRAQKLEVAKLETAQFEMAGEKINDIGRESARENGKGNGREETRHGQAQQRDFVSSVGESSKLTEATEVSPHNKVQQIKVDRVVDERSDRMFEVAKGQRASPSFKDITYYDRDAVLGSLTRSSIEQVFNSHIDHWVESPKAKISGNEIRYGSNGGFVVEADTGQWYSHYHGEGGDIFKYLSQTQGLSYKEAISEIGQSLGAQTSVYLSVEEQEMRHKAWQEAKDSERAERLRSAKIRTEKLYQKTTPIEGTIAERYLREHRKIEGDLPSTLRFLPAYTDPTSKREYPALVAFASDPEGKRTAAQITCLDPETANKAEVEVKKRSQGVIKGSVVEIQAGNVGSNTEEKAEKSVVYVAEGIETALSLKEAGLKGRIVATLGLSNMGNVGTHVKDKSEHIVLCGDADDKDTPARKTSEKSLEIIKDSGFNVILVRPDGEKGRDFNDVLKEKGVEAVRSCFESVLSHTKDSTAKLESEAPSARPRESAEQHRTQEAKPLSVDASSDTSPKDVAKASPSKPEVAIADQVLSALTERDPAPVKDLQMSETPYHKEEPTQDSSVQNKKDLVDAFKDVLDEREKMPLLLDRTHAQKERNLELKKQGMELAVEIRKSPELLKKAESLELSREVELYKGYYERDYGKRTDDITALNPEMKGKDLVDAFKEVLDERKSLPFMLDRTHEERERNLALKQEGLKLATAIQKDVTLSSKAEKLGLTKEVAHYASIHRDQISRAKSYERDGNGMGM